MSFAEKLLLNPLDLLRPIPLVTRSAIAPMLYLDLDRSLSSDMLLFCKPLRREKLEPFFETVFESESSRPCVFLLKEVVIMFVFRSAVEIIFFL